MEERVIPESISITLILLNPKKHTLEGNKLFFASDVRCAFEIERTKWIDAHELKMNGIDISIPLDRESIRNKKKKIKRDMDYIRDMQYSVKLCENVRVGLADDFILMPITDKNKVKRGHLRVYGYLGVSKK